MRKPLRSIAVAQTCPVRGDVPSNVEEHLRLARIGAAEGAQIIVFPELSLTGYEPALARELAFSEDDARLAPLREAAVAGSVRLIVGAPVRMGPRLHIGAFILAQDDTVMLYTKHHLGAFSESASCDGVVPPAESTVFDPGDRNPLVRFAGHAAAVAVCADVGRASHVEQAASRGIGAYLASMFVIPSEFESEAGKLSGYARQHSIVVALANFGSPSGGLAAAGRSSIWSEQGELLARLASSGAGIAIAAETEHGWRTKAVMLHGRVVSERP